MHTIQNGSSITIDHILTEEEFDSLKTLLFSYGKIGQVYFKDAVDVSTINRVKYLLETSLNQDDASIDKIILVDEEKSIEIISSMVTQNPDSWQVAYHRKDNRYKLTTLPKYRNMVSYVNKLIRDTNLADSQLEKIMVIYDELKKYFVLENTHNDKTPDDIIAKKGSQKTLSHLFSKVLTSIGIPNHVLDYKALTNKDKSMVLVKIEDDKYDINGFYFFAPLEEGGKDFYHFFGVTGEKMMCYSQMNTPSELLALCTEKEDLEFEHKLKYLRSTKQDESITQIEDTFKVSIGEIRQRLYSTPKIPVKDVYSVYASKEKALDLKPLSEKIFLENAYSESLFNRKKLQ